MKTNGILFAIALAVATSCTCNEHIVNELRAPAYPLVTIDPYVSTWSAADRLYDVAPTHWTDRSKALTGIISVDGTDYRFMGNDARVTYMVDGNAADNRWEARYTFNDPGRNWEKPDYDDSTWASGRGAFGNTDNRPNIGTDWKGGTLWLRRTIMIDESEMEGTFCLRHRDREVATYYINGVEVLVSPKEENNEIMQELSPEACALLHPGRNILAVKCVDNEKKRSLVECGIYRKVEVSAGCSNSAEQTLADVQATQTHYEFNCGPVQLRLDFSAPLYDLRNLELVSRPVNYISYAVKSLDGAEHDVNVRIIPSNQWGVNYPGMDCMEEEFDHAGMHFYKSGTKSQNVLGRKGDRICIDWGYFYFATPEDNKAEKGHFLIGYDDICSVQYFGENLRPYWNRSGVRTILDEFEAAEKDYAKTMKACERFDREMFAEAEAKGGRKYAELCALAYRQAITAHKLVVLPNGDLDLFSKENNSNGSIGTVDVTYPSAPIFLKYNPLLSEALMNHIYDYSESGRWTKPFPAHDIGTYPLANGQTYGADMPVEEAGNMIILTAATCAAKKDFSYAKKHWESLSAWVKYLQEDGLDPAEQLCTDDFAGHLSRNANLSIKAIMGIACYGYMADRLGDKETGEAFIAQAREAAQTWMKLADQGDHYGLVFEDTKQSWSQKYNLVWDKLLGLGIFPEEVAQKETAYYLTRQNQYGLPLDSRRNYTKSDWIVWTATMAESQEDFEAMIAPEWNFYNESTSRVPMSDWYNTDAPTFVSFIARSVVGGYFIKMLEF